MDRVKLGKVASDAMSFIQGQTETETEAFEVLEILIKAHKCFVASMQRQENKEIN